MLQSTRMTPVQVRGEPNRKPAQAVFFQYPVEYSLGTGCHITHVKGNVAIVPKNIQ